MADYRELVNVFRKLEIPTGRSIMVHTGSSFLSTIDDGEESTLLGALSSVYDSFLTPTFTYQTMVVPRVGPENNGLRYDQPPISQQEAVFFKPDLPSSPVLGKFAEALRTHPQANRSLHPILSFSGIDVKYALEKQTLSRPLAPIEILVDQGAWVFLLGVDQTVNFSIHYAEHLAGRKQFVRWALTPAGVKECPNFPGCSRGFNAIEPHIQGHMRKEYFFGKTVKAIPLQVLIPIARKLIREDPTALLCSHQDCARCLAVKDELA